MPRWAKFTLTLIGLGVVGCQTNPMVGHSLRQEGQYFGEISIVGNGSELTIQTGSQVPKLAIAGDICRITVEDGVVLGRIDIWGNGNTVSIPNDLRVSISQVGTNQVIRRKEDAEANAEAKDPAEDSEPDETSDSDSD